jgi:hypothetical protein
VKTRHWLERIIFFDQLCRLGFKVRVIFGCPPVAQITLAVVLTTLIKVPLTAAGRSRYRGQPFRVYQTLVDGEFGRVAREAIIISLASRCRSRAVIELRSECVRDAAEVVAENG